MLKKIILFTYLLITCCLLRATNNVINVAIGPTNGMNWLTGTYLEYGTWNFNQISLERDNQTEIFSIKNDGLLIGSFIGFDTLIEERIIKGKLEIFFGIKQKTNNTIDCLNSTCIKDDNH